MGLKVIGRKKQKAVYKLRDKAAFESFLAQQSFTVVVAYHYLCPECETYVKQFKKFAAEYEKEKELAFGKIHIQLEWMIKKAELTGDVSEENIFLKELDVGDAVPATLFIKNGSLVWKLDGVLSPPIFRGLVKKLMDAKSE